MLFFDITEDLRINLCGLNLRMPKNHLDGWQINTILREFCHIGMTQIVQPRLDVGGLSVYFQLVSDCIRMKVIKYKADIFLTGNNIYGVILFTKLIYNDINNLVCKISAELLEFKFLH